MCVAASDLKYRPCKCIVKTTVDAYALLGIRQFMIKFTKIFQFDIRKVGIQNYFLTLLMLKFFAGAVLQ